MTLQFNSLSSPSRGHHGTAAHVMPADPASGRQAQSAACPTEYRFDLIAAEDAGLLPRALEIVARLDIAPKRCTAVSDDTGRMTVSLIYRGLTADQSHTAADRMRNIFGVEAVTLSTSSADA
ncbi:hypothetical protein [Fodinicurvata sp. EGI_FJ10296]|uniref:hypothetical protein n=1 Tax=Fodinicurvata sp. EGI_FJ10296 TaxID=3231908 RepID=UPI0034521F3F